MNILHIMPSLARAFGGPTQSWVGYARAAESQGAKVTVAAPRVNDRDYEWLNRQTTDVNYALFRSGGKGAMVFSPGLQRWLAAHGKTYDVVHVHGLFNPISSLALRHCVKKQWPVVLRPFGTLSRYTFLHRRSWMKQRYFRYLDRPSLEKSGGVHFTTSAERDEAEWHGIDFEKRGHVVPPPLLDAQLSIKEKEVSPTVLFLSRLHPKKNIECLLDAWPGVQKVSNAARLIIAGDGDPEYVQQLKAYARLRDPNNQIEFVGFVAGEDKARLMAASTVFVLPSFQENFGVAVMEAIGAGLPVVISKYVQLASYVEQHDLGHVIETDAEALAFSITEIIRNHAYRKHCQEYGPERIQADFSVESVGRQLVSMYETVIEQHIN